MHHNILFTIQEKITDLPDSERKIGQYILDHPLEAIQLNAADLASRSQSSAAAVIRFCRSIGIKGFTELKLRISAEAASIQTELYTDILPDENLEQIKKKLLMNTHHILEESALHLENRQIETVVRLILQAPIVYIHGIGASYIVASDFEQKFSRVGKQIVCSQDEHFLLAALAASGEQALYIGISNSGEKADSIALMKTALALGLRTVSLTQHTENTLSKLADIALKTSPASEAPLRSGATTSLLSQLFAVDILFYCFLTQNYDQNISYLNRSRQAIDQFTHYQQHP